MESISVKAITIDCGYYDRVPMYSMIMADKGFNISNVCCERNITLYIPPGRRRQFQMSIACVEKLNNLPTIE